METFIITLTHGFSVEVYLVKETNSKKAVRLLKQHLGFISEDKKITVENMDYSVYYVGTLS